MENADIAIEQARELGLLGENILGSGFSFEDFCPFKMLFDYRLLAPSDILRCIPFIGQGLRKKYIHLMRNLIATQFVYKAKV